MSVSIPLQDTDLVPDCDGNVGHLPAVLAPFCGSGLGARGAPCLAPLVSSGPWSVRGQGGEHVVHLVSGVEGQGVVFYRATAILVPENHPRRSSSLGAVAKDSHLPTTGARTGSVVLVLLPLLLSSARKIHLVICSPRPVASGGVSFARLVAAPLHPPHLQLQHVPSLAEGWPAATVPCVLSMDGPLVSSVVQTSTPRPLVQDPGDAFPGWCRCAASSTVSNSPSSPVPRPFPVLDQRVFLWTLFRLLHVVCSIHVVEAGAYT